MFWCLKMNGNRDSKKSLGCSQYSISQREHSSLTLGVIVNRKVLLLKLIYSSNFSPSSEKLFYSLLMFLNKFKIILYKWKHAEEWITFSDDTVEVFQLQIHFDWQQYYYQGFDVLTELQCDEQPLVLSILSLSPQKGEIKIYLIIRLQELEV